MAAMNVEELLARYLRGALSAPLAAMHLLLETKDAGAAAAALTQIEPADDDARRRRDALARFMAEHRRDMDGIAVLLRDGIEPEPAGEGPAAWRALFDRLARQAPEAGVALYGFGNTDLLASFTEEVLGVLRAWRVIGRRSRVLDLGCGIGRVAVALAGEVAEVTGIDLSPEMIARARQRCAGLGNVHFVIGSGEDLAAIPDQSVELILAVDSFPYIVRGGPDLAAGHVAEAARVLTADGDLVIFNYSYRGDPAADAREVAHLGARHGFAVLRNGERPFTLWDAAAFHLRRPSIR